MCLAIELLPFQGVIGVRYYTQGAALGWELSGLSGRNKTEQEGKA